MWTYNYEYGNYLMHHGIKGQKWGVRRYQNKDGSLTPAGKQRYANATPGQTELYNSISSLSKRYLSVSDEVYKNAKTYGPIRRPYTTKTEMAYDATINTVRSIRNVRTFYYNFVAPEKAAVAAAEQVAFKNRFKSNVDKYLDKLLRAKKREQEAIRDCVEDLLVPYVNKRWCNSEDFGSADTAVKEVTFGKLLTDAFKNWDDYPETD